MNLLGPKVIEVKSMSFQLRLHNLEDEWKDYLPRKIINEFQTHHRDSR